MNEQVIRQYIEDSSSLISKQAEEIESLKEKVRKQDAERTLAKKAAEDILNDLADCLDSGQYTMDSVAKAIRNKDTGCLEKVSTEEVDDNSWGSLENTSENSLNMRPSDRMFYERFGRGRI